MDGAVAALCERVRLPGLLLLHRDPVESGRVHYRTWRHGHLEHEDGARHMHGWDLARSQPIDDEQRHHRNHQRRRGDIDVCQEVGEEERKER